MSDREKSDTEKKWEREMNVAAFDSLEFDFYSVNEWTPQPDGKGKVEQVHLGFHFKNRPDMFMFLRLKSRRAVDELIATLEKHRDGVWPSDA